MKVLQKMYVCERIYTMNVLVYAGSLEGDAYSHLSKFLRDDENIAGNLNESIRVCWGGCWGVGWVGDMRGGGDDFLVNLRILWFGGDFYVLVWQWMVWLWLVVRSWALGWWTI